MSDFTSKEFLRLRKEWYKKAADSGLRDIEIIDWRTGESGNLLKGFSLMDALKTYTPESEEYFSMARQFLWHMRRKRMWGDQFAIWKLHADGESLRGISRILGINRRRVTAIVRALEKKMFEHVRLEQAAHEHELDLDV